MAKSKAASAKRSPYVVALLIALMLVREERAIRLDREALRGIANAKIKMDGNYLRKVLAYLSEHGVSSYQVGKRELAFVDLSLQALRKALPQTLDDISGDIHWLEEAPSAGTRAARFNHLVDVVNSH